MSPITAYPDFRRKADPGRALQAVRNITATFVHPPSPNQHVLIVTVEAPILYVYTLYGPSENFPQSSGGVGGWEEIARPRRQAMTDYSGTPLWQVKIELMFDGWSTAPEGRSVQQEIQTLIDMATKAEGADQPPIVAFKGSIIPGSINRRWVINNLEWGPSVRRVSDGAIVRQVVTVTLLEYIQGKAAQFRSVGPANDAIARHSAEEAAAASAASRQAAEDAASIESAASAQANWNGFLGIPGDNFVQWAANAFGVPIPTTTTGTSVGAAVGGQAMGSPVAATSTPNARRTYRIKQGDTLAKIAAEQLGDSSGWQAIARLNNITDPRAVRVGQEILLPNSADLVRSVVPFL